MFRKQPFAFWLALSFFIPLLPALYVAGSDVGTTSGHWWHLQHSLLMPSILVTGFGSIVWLALASAWIIAKPLRHWFNEHPTNQ